MVSLGDPVRSSAGTSSCGATCAAVVVERDVRRVAGFFAYTTMLLPSSGFSSCSVRRVSAGALAMSHTSSRWYAVTSGCTSLVGPTRHFSHQ